MYDFALSSRGSIVKKSFDLDFDLIVVSLDDDSGPLHLFISSYEKETELDLEDLLT